MCLSRYTAESLPKDRGNATVPKFPSGSNLSFTKWFQFRICLSSRTWQRLISRDFRLLERKLKQQGMNSFSRMTKTRFGAISKLWEMRVLISCLITVSFELWCIHPSRPHDQRESWVWGGWSTFFNLTLSLTLLTSSSQISFLQIF